MTPSPLAACLMACSGKLGGGGCACSFRFTQVEDELLPSCFFLQKTFDFFFFFNLSGNEISVLAINMGFDTLNFPPPCSQGLVSGTQNTFGQRIPLLANFPHAYYSFP